MNVVITIVTGLLLYLFAAPRVFVRLLALNSWPRRTRFSCHITRGTRFRPSFDFPIKPRPRRCSSAHRRLPKMQHSFQNIAHPEFRSFATTEEAKLFKRLQTERKERKRRRRHQRMRRGRRRRGQKSRRLPSKQQQRVVEKIHTLDGAKSCPNHL